MTDEFEELIEDRVNRFLARRPPAFAVPGWLNTDVHAWLEAMVRGEVFSLLLGGPTGTGKSWSCWKSVETLIRNGWRGRWEIIPAFEFHRIIAPPVDTDRLDRIARCEFLALDDVGAMRIGDWAAECLHGVIDHRWSNRLPTVIATNNPDLPELLGDRIASRLSDGLTAVILDGPDRRAM